LLLFKNKSLYNIFYKMRKDNRFQVIYKKLLALHGPQGWWPIRATYHPKNYAFPQTPEELFEICVGAILTQNTNFKSVEIALNNLRTKELLDPKKLLTTSDDLIKTCIKPSGYFNQKTKKLFIFTDFFLKLKNRCPLRHELLSLWGIGPETADSMLLYGWHQPIFVVDAYTRRIFLHLKLIDASFKYEDIREMFEQNLPPDYILFNEYHALIVEHAKRFYAKKPYGFDCPIGNYLSKRS